MGSYLFKDCSRFLQTETSVVDSRVALLCALLMARIEANTDREHLLVSHRGVGKSGQVFRCRS